MQKAVTGLNRTRVELKQTVVLACGIPSEWFESNQSGIETCANERGFEGVTLFESNQSGIETHYSKASDTIDLGLNRTRVELKLIDLSVVNWSAVGLNRTRVELKHARTPRFREACARFESNQSGIETEPSRPVHANEGHSLNRTRVELKLGLVEKRVWNVGQV